MYMVRKEKDLGQISKNFEGKKRMGSGQHVHK
jgi:hypothetical protein